MNKIFVATPLYNGLVSHMYLRGALQTQKTMGEGVSFSLTVGTYLVINREVLMKRFLESGCSHILYVDGDIGWGVESLKMLIDSEVDFVSGIYLKRTGDHGIPIEILEGGQVIRDGKLIECLTVPAGFLLLSRNCIEMMLAAYDPVWCMDYQDGRYIGEDVAFCYRWRMLGGKVWAHNKVILDHIGEVIFSPKEVIGQGFGQSVKEREGNEP